MVVGGQLVNPIVFVVDLERLVVDFYSFCP